MKISFLGAAGTVTGSCYLVETDHARFLVDCGMFQGSSELHERNAEPFSFDPASIDFVLLTHAHIDHSGLLPKLVRNGFVGTIYATSATADLCSIMLPDSAHIQEEDLVWLNRKRKRAGKPPEEPLYTRQDAEATIALFRKVPYRQQIPVGKGMQCTFFDAGHILGSSFIQLVVEEGGQEKTIVFSGDLGNRGQQIIKDPEGLPAADYVLVESTYGERLHKSRTDTVAEFRNIITEALSTRGTIIIPAFAVERTQDILYELHAMIQEGSPLPFPIFIDSPLAISATEIFRKHEECFDRDMWEYLVKGEDPFAFESVHFTRETEESKSINRFEQAIIISASGMCTAGRIQHHLKHNLWKENAHVIFVGYQAKGSLGRRIVDGDDQVRILGEEIAVKSHIHTLGGFSAHADQRELLHWLGTAPQAPQKVFLVHGEDSARETLAGMITQEHGYNTHIPEWKEQVEL